MIRFAFACMLAGLATVSSADDGVIEINQLCVPSGCFSGDSPGFPVEVTQPGSYRLTSDLVVPESFSGIFLNGSGITIDLGGHSIHGSVECTGTNPVCSQTGPLHGVEAQTFGAIQDLTIRNGTVRGFGANCLALTQGGSAEGVLLQDLHISNCAGDGVDLGGHGLIESVTVLNVGGNGIDTGPSTLVRDSNVRNAGGYGVNGGICSGNIFADNGDLAAVPEENCSNQIDVNICNASTCP